MGLVTDAHIRKLNRLYRKNDAVTDVLSFGGGGERDPGLGPRGSKTQDRIPDPEMGDIVIATGVARRQARDAGHSYQTELRVLALHGLLHLAGYDHAHTSDAGRMARVEARLRRKGGLAAGLIERASGRRRTGARR